MKNYKIELYTKPLFDKQHLYRVFGVDYGRQASDYKETIILSGNAKLHEIVKDIKYWSSKN